MRSATLPDLPAGDWSVRRAESDRYVRSEALRRVHGIPIEELVRADPCSTSELAVNEEVERRTELEMEPAFRHDFFLRKTDGNGCPEVPAAVHDSGSCL